jgi:hypothetical protein
MGAGSDIRVAGDIIVYRLFEVGYEIDLERAADLLSPSAPERAKPVRGEAEAIQIANPPVTVTIGRQAVHIGDRDVDTELSARLFDFGVVSMRLRLAVPADCDWHRLRELGRSLARCPLDDLFARRRDELLERIRPAIRRHGPSRALEEYTIHRLHGLSDAAGIPVPPDALSDDDIAGLLLNESRPLSGGAVRDMLSPRFSYYPDDLAVLAWGAALVIEPNVDDADVPYVLEFANAQLLELRYHDLLLDAELPRVYEETAAARKAFRLLGRRFSRLLGNLQARVADATESVERAENSLKVTDDVYLARIYTSALEIFRGPTWRRGIDRKIEILRDTYTMLNAESQALRTELLELTIIVLIVLEIVLALWGMR